MTGCSFLNHATVCGLLDPFSRRLPSVLYQLANDIGEAAFFADGVSHVIYSTPTSLSSRVGPVPMPPGTSCVSVWFTNSELPVSPDAPFSEADINFRVDIPTVMLGLGLNKFHIYRIRLHVPEYEAQCSADNIPDNPLYRGYIGITKRHFYRRFKEHRAAADVGGSSTLYSAWSYLKRNSLTHYPALQLLGSAETLEEAYSAEEHHVALKTLNPLGLNTIPGGMAGIKMLHELRALNGTTTPSIEDRDRAALKVESAPDRNVPCAHFRAGHMRRLPTGKLTYVKATFVNPVREIAI